MSVLTIDTDCLLNLLCQIKSGSMRSDIAGVVAAMTENELDALGGKSIRITAPLVDRDSRTRWASGLAVQFDVGELFHVRSREAISVFIFHWHQGCYGWLARFILKPHRQ